MTRRTVSNAFALAGAALVVCGFVFSKNGGIVTLAVFGGWVCLMGVLGSWRWHSTHYPGALEEPTFHNDPSNPANVFGRPDRNFDSVEILATPAPADTHL